ncbi:hypothetical protein HMPREF9554_03140 [Treponema phagedenis F0421]|nr:hypothetical protein HMPREF9554_03140 [Treponema phagedenis F0421]
MPHLYKNFKIKENFCKSLRKSEKRYVLKCQNKFFEPCRPWQNYALRVLKLPVIKKSSTRRKGEPLELLPLVRLRVLPVCNKVSGKTSFGILQRWAIYHSDA